MLSRSPRRAGSFQARDGAAPFTIKGSYLDPAPDDWVGEWGGIRVAFHTEHRPLEAYGRALETAGLLIEAIREPKGARRAGRPRPRWAALAADSHVLARQGGEAMIDAGPATSTRCYEPRSRSAMALTPAMNISTPSR